MPTYIQVRPVQRILNIAVQLFTLSLYGLPIRKEHLVEEMLRDSQPGTYLHREETNYPLREGVFQYS